MKDLTDDEITDVLNPFMRTVSLPNRRIILRSLRFVLATEHIRIVRLTESEWLDHLGAQLPR